MRVLGRKTRPTDSAIIVIIMEVDTRASGCPTSNTVRVSKSGQMVQNTRVNTKRVKNMAKENSCGLTKAHTKATSLIIISMDAVSTAGPTDVSSTATGSTIAWRVMESLLGATDESTSESTKMTRSTATVCSLGLTAAVTMANGSRVSNTAKEFT